MSGGSEEQRGGGPEQPGGAGSGRRRGSRIPRRHRPPDPGYFSGPRRTWSPSPMASTGVDDHRELQREIDELVRRLREQGPLAPRELSRQVEARFWGPGRFRRALAIARRRGLIERRGRQLYAAK
jgi:hypothetical protein